jgi:hypothetical protein
METWKDETLLLVGFSPNPQIPAFLHLHNIRGVSKEATKGPGGLEVLQHPQNPLIR